MRGWIDDAIELLFTMPWSCALDVVDQHPAGLPAPSVGFVLGATKQSIAEVERKPEVADALRRLREFLDAEDADPER